MSVSDRITIQSHQGPYTAVFDDQAIAKLNAAPPKDAHVIVDARVAEIYADRLGNLLKGPSVLRIEASEEAKSLERFPAYIEHLLTAAVRRGQVLLAIGGGITQDITCFLAATLLRGIDWHFYPTTLLAQCDSCIGSKSSINTGGAKNILGTFTPPRHVTISTEFLDSLDPGDLRSGLGEMLKVHAIEGPKAFDRIATDYGRIFQDRKVMADYIRRSLLIKQPYIEEDEFDRGKRNIFNYGHSFGHAIEAATDFAIPHGIAVTIGMDMANYVASKLDVGSEANYRRMHPVLAENYADHARRPIPFEPFLAAIAKDKKNLGSGSVTLILPDREGRIFKDSYPIAGAFRAASDTYLKEGRRA